MRPINSEEENIKETIETILQSIELDNLLKDQSVHLEIESIKTLQKIKNIKD